MKQPTKINTGEDTTPYAMMRDGAGAVWVECHGTELPGTRKVCTTAEQITWAMYNLECYIHTRLRINAVQEAAARRLVDGDGI